LYKMQQKYKQKAIKHIKQQQTGNQQSFTAKQHFNEEEKKRSNKSCHITAQYAVHKFTMMLKDCSILSLHRVQRNKLINNARNS